MRTDDDGAVREALRDLLQEDGWPDGAVCARGTAPLNSGIVADFQQSSLRALSE